jgi:hypothetical protein
MTSGRSTPSRRLARADPDEVALHFQPAVPSCSGGRSTTRTRRTPADIVLRDRFDWAPKSARALLDGELAGHVGSRERIANTKVYRMSRTSGRRNSTRLSTTDRGSAESIPVRAFSDLIGGRIWL